MEVVKGGVQVRRIHIIYYLSSLGRTEQPHLIRVHHLARNGVHLRDVKRWLGELRGKEMAEAFAWSYKRKYKTGYVWQDLLDDDLITPISDNEYVLKGSQIHPTPYETCVLDGKKASLITETCVIEEGKHLYQKQPSVPEVQIQRCPDLKTNSQVKLPSEIGSDRSTLTDENESSKVEEKKHVGTGKQKPDEQSREKPENYSLHYSLYHNLLSKKSNNQSNKDDKIDTPETSFSTSSSSSSLSSSSSQSSVKDSGRFSTGASGLFRNLITCGAIDANQEELAMIDRSDKNVPKSSKNKDDVKAEICKGDKFGGSARNLGSGCNLQQQQEQQQQYYPARKSCDAKSTNMNKKTLGEFLNQAPQKPFGGSICF